MYVVLRVGGLGAGKWDSNEIHLGPRESEAGRRIVSWTGTVRTTRLEGSSYRSITSLEKCKKNITTSGAWCGGDVRPRVADCGLRGAVVENREGLRQGLRESLKIVRMGRHKMDCGGSSGRVCISRSRGFGQAWRSVETVVSRESYRKREDMPNEDAGRQGELGMDRKQKQDSNNKHDSTTAETRKQSERVKDSHKNTVKRERANDTARVLKLERIDTLIRAERGRCRVGEGWRRLTRRVAKRSLLRRGWGEASYWACGAESIRRGRGGGGWRSTGGGGVKTVVAGEAEA
ncbi:hypothetical protein DFH06DRAFT_1150869 [Mycena polygramma]|nr:hypothetical protein DFH06DRAFT_1150869 [Mycena polygramma]